MKRVLHISQKEIDLQAKAVFDPVNYGESGIGLCYPGCRIEYNLTAFVQSRVILKKYLGKFYSRFALMIISLELGETLESFYRKVAIGAHRFGYEPKGEMNLAEICRAILGFKMEPYFYVLNAHLVDSIELKKIMGVLHDQIGAQARVNGMIFFETHIAFEPYASILKNNSTFLQNVIHFPVYSDEESRQFLENLGKDWGIAFPKAAAERMRKLCGGYLWLLREAGRVYRRKGEVGLENLEKEPGIQMRLRTIFELYSTQEQQWFGHLTRGNISLVPLDFVEFLLAMRVVVKTSRGYEMVGELFRPMLRQSYVLGELNCQAGRVFYSQKEITHHLTVMQRKIVALFCEHKGHIVTREDVAKVMWGKEWPDIYSEWAIDKTISRLRKTLEGIGFSGEVIQTKKGSGFLVA